MSRLAWRLGGGLLAVGSFCALSLAGGRAAPPALVIWTVGPLVKVRPDHRPPEPLPPPSATLFAARNEFEAFQVALRGVNGAYDAIDVDVGDFVGPGGRLLRAENATVYLQRFLDVRRPSSVEGGTGEWPDALVPRIDRYAGERRNAFPFRVPAQRTQPVWIELYVPPDTPAGLYTGRVQVRAAGLRAIDIPVDLTVWGFTLPSTSSLPTTFGLNGLGALRQWRGRYTDDEELLQANHLYMRALLAHRLSAHGGTMAPPPFVRTGDGVVVDWRFYDREMGPFLDGTVFGAGEPLAGARATTVELRSPVGLDEPTQVAYWREWVRHFEEKGWLDRLYHYVWDEPAPRDYPRVADRARVARVAGPMLPNLVTAPFDAGLAPLISIWAPVVNCFDDKPGPEKFCQTSTTPMEAYASELKSGKRVWWYQSCGSHGCNIVGGDYFTGWPSYVVDVDAVAHRVMEWLTWKYRIGGELYFNATEAFNRDVDPWTDLLMHGGNGDGTLFYPGRPDRIGGQTYVPVESLRLKLIRDGLEDYEYFVLLAHQGAADVADGQVARVVRRTYDWDRRPETLESARRELGFALDRVR